MRKILFVLIALFVVACTLKVEPTVTIDCVEIDYPFQKAEYCDGGLVQTPPPPHDAGKDGG